MPVDDWSAVGLNSQSVGGGSCGCAVVVQLYVFIVLADQKDLGKWFMRNMAFLSLPKA